MPYSRELYDTAGDFHTHTLVSQHAYSTLHEMIASARDRGLKALAVTDHGPGIIDGANRHHFLCLPTLPRVINGIHLYIGVEANIMDYQGTLDLDEQILGTLDFVIASYHIDSISTSTEKDHTRGWLSVIQNPHVDCLGHCGNPVFPFDHEPVIRACADQEKIVEINSASPDARPGSKKNCVKIAKLCEKYKVPVIINSDAHSCYRVGDHEKAKSLLAEIQFPPDLIINTSIERIKAFFQKRGRQPLSIQDI